MYTLGIYGIKDPLERPPIDLHDHSLVLMNKGKVITFVELERISRKKHDNRLHLYLEDLIDAGTLILPDRLRVVFVDAFSGREFITRDKHIHLVAPDTEDLFDTFQPASGYFFNHDVEIWVCSHELAHIGTHLAFTGGFKENSLLVHIDGGASNSNCSVWLYKDGRIQHIYHSWELQPQTVNFDLNPLSNAILGLPEGANLGVAGRLMGYASFGKPNPELKAWLKSHKWFQDCKGGNISKFFVAVKNDYNWITNYFDTRDPFLMDIAACMQEDLQENVERFIIRFQKQTGAKHLYYSGGVALNIKINSSLENSGYFESIHVPPCCNDSGLALGAASLLEFLTYGAIELHTPFLNSLGLKSYSYKPEFDIRDVAAQISQNKVVGICIGNGEVGPRALGHRSLIANPCTVELRDYISTSMKQREWYRPVAPMVLKREADKLFEGISSSSLAYYMLGNYKVHPSVRDWIPGVVHIDGSARVQVVDERDPELKLIVDILTELRDSYNIPCVINTSFNRRSEPIVHTHDEAVRAAQEMGVDALILDNELLYKSQFQG